VRPLRNFLGSATVVPTHNTKIEYFHNCDKSFDSHIRSADHLLLVFRTLTSTSNDSTVLNHNITRTNNHHPTTNNQHPRWRHVFHQLNLPHPLPEELPRCQRCPQEASRNCTVSHRVRHPCSRVSFQPPPVHQQRLQHHKRCSAPIRG
jgi:hypothetical protein